MENYNGYNNRPGVFVKLDESEQRTNANYYQERGNLYAPMGAQDANCPPVRSTNYCNGVYTMGATPIANMTLQPWNDPAYTIYQEHEVINMQMEKKAAETRMKIEEKAALEKIHTDAIEEQTKRRADISSKRELQETKISILKDGEILIRHELFGSDVKKRVPFNCISHYRLKCIGNSDEEILYMRLRFESGEEKEIYLDGKKLEDSYIRKKFRKAGAGFNLFAKKEIEMCSKLITEVIKLSPELYISRRYGWFENNGKVGFAFPGDPVWEEVEKYAL